MLFPCLPTDSPFPFITFFCRPKLAVLIEKVLVKNDSATLLAICFMESIVFAKEHWISSLVSYLGGYLIYPYIVSCHPSRAEIYTSENDIFSLNYAALLI